MSSAQIHKLLEREFDIHDSKFKDPAAGPSRYREIAGTDTRIGFISPMSNNFCASCNRVRVTVEGRLLLCLGNEHSLDLREIIRRNPGEREKLKQAISGAMQRKPERHYFDPDDITITRHMSASGG